MKLLAFGNSLPLDGDLLHYELYNREILLLTSVSIRVLTVDLKEKFAGHFHLESGTEFVGCIREVDCLIFARLIPAEYLTRITFFDLRTFAYANFSFEVQYAIDVKTIGTKLFVLGSQMLEIFQIKKFYDLKIYRTGCVTFPLLLTNLNPRDKPHLIVTGAKDGHTFGVATLQQISQAGFEYEIYIYHLANYINGFTRKVRCTFEEMILKIEFCPEVSSIFFLLRNKRMVMVSAFSGKLATEFNNSMSFSAVEDFSTGISGQFIAMREQKSILVMSLKQKFTMHPPIQFEFLGQKSPVKRLFLNENENFILSNSKNELLVFK